MLSNSTAFAPEENPGVAQLAEHVLLPLISGGDPDGREPNACVNLTNAATFPEFVEEIRRDGWSDVLFMPQYREPFRLRILQNMTSSKAMINTAWDGRARAIACSICRTRGPGNP